jgi:hypothetical protein
LRVSLRLALLAIIVVALPVLGAEEDFPPLSIFDSQVGLGPLSIRPQAFLASLRPQPLPLVPATRRAGDLEAALLADWTNTLSSAEGYHLDFEMIRSSFLVAYAATDTISVGGDFGFAHRSGGALDDFIDGFHSFASLPDRNEAGARRNRHAILLGPAASRDLAIGEDVDATGFTDAILFATKTIRPDAPLPALAVSAWGRVPLGRERDLLGTGRPGIGLSIGASLGLGPPRVEGHAGRWAYLYSGATLGYSETEEVAGIRLRPFDGSAFVAAEVQVVRRLSLVVQAAAILGSTDDLRRFEGPAFEVSFGFKVEVVEGAAVLEIGAIENAVNIDPSPDFGLHAALAWRF